MEKYVDMSFCITVVTYDFEPIFSNILLQIEKFKLVDCTLKHVPLLDINENTRKILTTRGYEVKLTY